MGRHQIKVIACATVIQEMLPLLPADVPLIFGPWDEEVFVVTAPGETISYADFKTTSTTTPNLASFNYATPNQ